MAALGLFSAAGVSLSFRLPLSFPFAADRLGAELPGRFVHFDLWLWKLGLFLYVAGGLPHHGQGSIECHGSMVDVMVHCSTDIANHTRRGQLLIYG